MEIELSVKISEKEFVKINEEIFNQKRLFIKRRTLFKVTPFLLAPLLLLIVLIDTEKGISIMDSLYGNAWIICGIVVAFFIPELFSYLFMKTYQKNKSIFEIVHYLINDEFIEAKTSLSEGKISWKAIVQVQELSEWFLLRPNKISFHALPKNQLNPSQQTWLRYKITKN
jgi:YcxB-like protein